ncbi:hypothetical protein [Rhizobium tropici]|uniref:Uncharacterized protein n=1 Tax=Rhizobium tropici TaxID=398 RepID=A0A329Y8T0_RHITR|nr:hypothetical protein [Rhizobium tropici]RAX39777.1 hypothetical protein DQ393_19835 [Rhizobium tropici]
MTISLIWPLFIAFFVLALISPFLPLFLMWRSVALSVLALVSFRLLRGPVHWTDQDVGYSIGIALLTWFLSIVFLALALRLCIAAYYDRLRSEIMLGENTRWIDRVLLAVTGAVVGLALTISMASLLGGSSGRAHVGFGYWPNRQRSHDLYAHPPGQWPRDPGHGSVYRRCDNFVRWFWANAPHH